MLKKKTLIIIILILTISVDKSFSQELKIDPMYRIQLLIQMGKYESAIEFTEKLKDSLICEKSEILGFSYNKLGKYDLAAEHYENYIKNCEENSIQRINLGDNYFRNNQLVQAIEQFLKVNENDPNYSLAQYNIGMIEYKKGNKEKAVEYFTSAINNTKDEVLDFNYVEMLIKTLNELENYDSAFKNIETLLELWNENSAEYKYTLIIQTSIYGAQKKYKTAIKKLQNIIDSGIINEDVLLEAYAYQLDYYFKIKKKRKACNVYKKINTIDSESPILKEFDCK